MFCIRLHLTEPENKKHRPQLHPFLWPSSTQLNSCPTTWYSTWDMSPSVPCPVSRCNTISDIKDKENWSCPTTSSGHHQEEESPLIHFLNVICISYEDQEFPCWVSAKNRSKASSPVSRSAESSPSQPKTEGPRQKLMLWSSAEQMDGDTLEQIIWWDSAISNTGGLWGIFQPYCSMNL